MKFACRRGTIGRTGRGGRAAILALVVACHVLEARGQEQSVVVSDEGELPQVVEDFAEPLESVPVGGWPVAAPLTNHAQAAWIGQADQVWLWRGNVPSVPLFTDANASVVLDANDAASTAATGPRISIIRRLGARYALEGNYLNVGTFTGHARLPDTGAAYQIEDLGNLPNFGDVASAGVAGSSVFKSAEFNARAWTGGSVTWLAGFRWVEFDDRMNIAYQYSNPDPFGSGNLASSTGNNLFGGQVGADMRLWNNGGAVRVDGIAKAGAFYNNAYQRTTASFTDATGLVEPAGAVATDVDALSFVGEVSLNASVSLTRWLAWRAGYSVFWLSGVATAPQQLASSDIPNDTGYVKTSGSVLLHGVTTGIEARW